MPFTPEEKRAYYAEKRKQEKEVAARLADIDKFKTQDEAEDFAKGEFNSWCELHRIFNGVDPKGSDEEPKSRKKEAKFINPSTHDFLNRGRLTFEQWLELRRLYRRDLWALMELIGEGRWSEQAHRPVANFFVKKDNSRMPMRYSKGDQSRILSSLEKQKDGLLLYPRGNRKSTISLIDSVQWVINFPDIVILICTSTKTLARRFVKVLRGYFSVSNYNDPTPFQILFPDYCIPEDKGKESGDVREFWCPKRRLKGTVNPTISFTSMESGTAGVRADVIKFDDPVDEQNYRNPEQRVQVREKYDFIRQLLVGGYCEAIGTRYTDGLRGDSEDGPEPDLYGTILKRAKGNDRLKRLIASAWTVLPEFLDVPIKKIERQMVTLLFPNLPCVCGAENDEEAEVCVACGEPMEISPGCFSKLHTKCEENENNFRCQQLNEPAAELDDEDEYVNTFTEANIRHAMKEPGWKQTITGYKYIFVDTAMTAGRKSDYSAFAVVQIENRGEDLPPIVWYLEIRANRYSDQQVAETIAELMAKWQCGAYVEEIPSTGVTFKNEVIRQTHIRGAQNFALRWFTPSQEPKAKETRIRTLQMLHEQGLLRFIMGPWIDLMMKQLVGYAGHKPKGKSGRKDDIPDAMSYVYKVLPYIGYLTDEEKKQREEEIQKEFDKQRRQAQYKAMFGDEGGPASAPMSGAEPDRPRNPIGDALAPLRENARKDTTSFNVIRRRWDGQ